MRLVNFILGFILLTLISLQSSFASIGQVSLYEGNAVIDRKEGESKEVEKDLDVIETAIRNLISGGAIKEYKIGTRNAKKYELAELLTLKSQYKVELVRKKQAETMANGLGNPRATFVRFDGAY